MPIGDDLKVGIALTLIMAIADPAIHLNNEKTCLLVRIKIS